MSNRFAGILLGVVLVAMLLSGLDPKNRADWALENVIVLVAIPMLVWVHTKAWLSRMSYLMIVGFLLLHEVGAHYTYSEVPYDDWFRHLTGHSLQAALGWERNHFDRLIHLLFGLLIVVPVREGLVHTARLSSAWSYALAISVIVSVSTLYELIEWGASVVFGGELGMAYLGTQGDIWDAHKDMALAMVGALVITALRVSITRLRAAGR
ncbi:MAG: DUF2238 domain-containing protein [Burkholderiaceae bacterium]